MTAHAIYVSSTTVYIQWTERSPFLAIHDDGTTTEQFREPTRASRIAIGPATSELRDAAGRPSDPYRAAS